MLSTKSTDTRLDWKRYDLIPYSLFVIGGSSNTKSHQSEFYDAIMPRIKGGTIPDVFATRDERLHRQMRRPVANLYSATNLTTFEPLITSTMEYFFQRLDEKFADKANDLDLFSWMQYFMFDVLGQVTFSRGLGCLEKGGDVDDVIENNWRYFKKIAPVSCDSHDTSMPSRVSHIPNIPITRTHRCPG